MSNKGKVLTIVRELWERGNPLTSKMRTSSGKMCCLGFDAVACGFKPEHLTGTATPSSLFKLWIPLDVHKQRFGQYFAKRLVGKGIAKEHTEAVSKAIGINDRASIDDTEREARLIPLLKEIGGYSEVRFID